MATTQKATVKGLRERLQEGDSVIIAEGYIMELERRGYVSLGVWCPTVILEKPEVVRMLHEEWVHAGSDVVIACTYCSHKTQLDLLGLGDEFEKLNRTALQLARQVANEHGKLMAGGICNTLIYTPNRPDIDEKICQMFKEQIEWAIEEGADFMVCETYHDYGEAVLALDCMKKYGKGLPVVVTLAAPPSGQTFDGVDLAEACRRLEKAGADVVGLNCIRGPDSILPLMQEIRKLCKGPIACIPVPIRTNNTYKASHQLRTSRTGTSAAPSELDEFLCSRSHIQDFAKEAKEIGIQYIGMCCGNKAIYMREIAEVYGRTPPASSYGPRQHVTTLDDEERAWQKKHYIESLRDYPPDN